MSERQRTEAVSSGDGAPESRNVGLILLVTGLISIPTAGLWINTIASDANREHDAGTTLFVPVTVVIAIGAILALVLMALVAANIVSEYRSGGRASR